MSEKEIEKKEEETEETEEGTEATKKPAEKKPVAKKGRVAEVAANDEVEEEETEEEKVPKAIPVKHDIIRLSGKNYHLPVFQIVNYPNGVVLYDDKGNKASPLTSGKDEEGNDMVVRLRKTCAVFNIQNRRKYHPSELREAQSAPAR